MLAAFLPLINCYKADCPNPKYNPKALDKPSQRPEKEQALIKRLMATNPPSGDGHRNGAVKDRSQVQNPKTGLWVKRHKDTGQFMDNKMDGKPFKGVRKER